MSPRRILRSRNQPPMARSPEALVAELLRAADLGAVQQDLLHVHVDAHELVALLPNTNPTHATPPRKKKKKRWKAGRSAASGYPPPQKKKHTGKTGRSSAKPVGPLPHAKVDNREKQSGNKT